MSTTLLGILFLFACVGLFVVLDRIGRPTVRGILSGPLNKFYLKYLQSSTKHEFDAASAENNLDRAWSGVIFEKVYQIGVSGVPYSQREKNLEYIKAEVISKPQIRRKLADELIKVLPKQYKNGSFQTKLACYVCELLKNTHINNGSPSKPIHSIAIDNLTTAISAWIAGIVYLLLSLYVLDDYPPLIVAFSNFLLFLLMILPLINLIGTKLAKLTTVSTIATIIILFLGVYATFAHSRAQLPMEIDLNPYQNPGAKITVRSSEWLTMNSINCDGKQKISVSVHGQIATPIRFHVNDSQFYFMDKDCLSITPQIELTQPENQAFEFYLVAQDSAPFFSGKKDVKVVPSYVTAANEIDFGSDDVIRIKLEHGFWNLMSKFYLAIGSFSATALFYFMNSILNKKNP